MLGKTNLVYTVFSPATPAKSKQYAQILVKGIEKLRQTGNLDKILAKYGLEDWEK